MADTSLRLNKKEKLCSTVAIDQLFGRGGAYSGDTRSALAYPFRAVWRNNPRRRSDAPAQFLISIPKRRLRQAVDRVLMRRRAREAYRLLRHEYPITAGARLDIAFIYVASETIGYFAVEKSMRRLLSKISKSSTALTCHEPAQVDNADENAV